MILPMTGGDFRIARTSELIHSSKSDTTPRSKSPWVPRTNMCLVSRTPCEFGCWFREISKDFMTIAVVFAEFT